ncbi:MAG TPA: fructose bisphosphate aldolase [Candidatus Peribacteraceae bacterium]|nr:fructose bisphosphate aldolase [Candidatus Peribacteraceae bacterium]
MKNTEASERIAQNGFIAALDQSGGSTPKALEAYGVDHSEWQNDQQMFELVHEMRTRIMTNSAFDQRVSGAILFERTMLSDVEGMPTPKYLWERKKIVPFLKVDDGLASESNHVQLMKEIVNLDERLKRAVELGIFGTKMRSVVHSTDEQGIRDIVDQQFAFGNRIIEAGLMPIIEPEVNIHAEDKLRAEQVLRDQVQRHLDALPSKQKVMLKLTLPDEPNFYRRLVEHPRVLRVVALSGGYSRKDANEKLAQNNGVTASFSRALVEDLNANQSDDEFTAKLNAAIQSIYDASIT